MIKLRVQMLQFGPRVIRRVLPIDSSLFGVSVFVPGGHSDPKKIERARKLYNDANMPVQEILSTLNISRTFYRYVGKKGQS